MAEEIVVNCSKLNIDEEEGDVIEFSEVRLDEDNNKLSLMLMGRLLTERPYNVEAFKRIMSNVWAPANGMVIRVFRPNMYAFQFFHWRDKEKVLEGRPWCFDNTLIMLKEVDDDEQPDQVTITHSPFWVRVKNLPFNCRSDTYVKALVGGMGEILDLEEDILGIGRYIRVKIMLDTSRPIHRTQRIKDKRGREVKVEYAYDWLPFFFFASLVKLWGSQRGIVTRLRRRIKRKKLGWSMDQRATPRKGRMKEVEEIESIIVSNKQLL